MQVRQAIVSTPNSRALKHNELVSISDDISDELAERLCRWSPERNEIAYGETQSINFFQPVRDVFAVSRSVFGELESNLDVGRRINTHILLFDREQLAGYENNIALLVHVLRSHGALLLQTSPSEWIPKIEVPSRAHIELIKNPQAEYLNQTEKIVHAIDIHGEVVLLGLPDPLEFLGSFLTEIPIEDRLDISFSTGLRVSESRRFTFQFFRDEDPDLLHDLANRQLRTISFKSKSWSPQSRVTGSLNDC